MGKKNKHSKSKTQKLPTTVTGRHRSSFKSKKNLVALTAMLIATYLVFSPMLRNDFTNWDDNLYVLENPLIKTLDASTVKRLFTEPLAFNYHPLTALSLNLNYQYAEFNPKPYFFTNLALHLLNCALVFYLLWLITKGNFFIAFGVSVLFAVHPMHVESVAWLSERKDVLYSAFFLLGLISYLRYVKLKKMTWFILTGILFVLSLLSKPSAVVFPVILCLFDYYYKRGFSYRILLEKVPFFGLSVVFGIITLRLQEDFVNNIGGESISFVEKVMATFYSLYLYFSKFFIPTHLSSFHSYPDFDNMPMTWLLGPIIILLCAGLWFKDTSRRKVWEFGLGFFFINLGLVLPFVAIGEAVMSERYTYLPYIGLSFVLLYYLNKLLENKSMSDAARQGIYGLVIVVLIWFASLSHQRTKIWNNSKVLWTDVISQYPDTDKAYANRGSYYMAQSQFDLAQKDYEKSISLAEGVYSTYYNLGLLYQKKNQIDKAIELYKIAIERNPSKFEPYNNLGGLHVNKGLYQDAVGFYDNAIKANPKDANGWFNRGTSKYNLSEYQSAAEDYKQGLSIQPNNAERNFYLALCFENLGQFQESLSALQNAIRFAPEIAKYYYFNARVLEKSGRKQEALTSANKAIELGHNVPESLMVKLR